MSKHARPAPRGRTAVRLVTAAFVAGSAALAFVPVAHADTSATLTPTAEAWYQPNPSCAQPSGCVTPGALPAQPPANNPYPARSLHVGLSAGQETARSFLVLPFTGVTGTITAASLTVPLDTTQADGSGSPETAKLQACLTSATVTSADGSYEAPPKTDCSSSAQVSYVATPQPHLQADLGPLLSRLSSATGIALLPDDTKAAPTDSWRVVFSAHDRTDPAKTAPASVTLTVADPPADTFGDDPFGPVSDSGNPGFGAVAPPVGIGFAPAPPVNLPGETAVPPTVVPPSTLLTIPVAQPQTITVGYAYPAVWLLPLVFLVLVPAAARALTKDLAPVT